MESEDNSQLSTPVVGQSAVDRNQVNASFVRLGGDVMHIERESHSTSNPVTHVVLDELEVVKADTPKVNKFSYLMFSMWVLLRFRAVSSRF